jgi:hypothetical protein
MWIYDGGEWIEDKATPREEAIVKKVLSPENPGDDELALEVVKMEMKELQQPPKQ